MKELSTEEKAKAYDRVSKEVKDFFEGRQKMYSDVNQTLEYLFPELKESEDERIRKELVAFLKETIEYGGISPDIWTMDNANKWLAWLEAQCEHANFRNAIQIGDKVTRNEDGVLVNLSQLNRVAKKDNKVEPKFHEGDWVVNTVGNTNQVIKVLDDGYTLDDNTFLSNSWAIEHYHLWTIQDVKDGDVLATKDAVFIFKYMDKTGLSLCKSYCEVIGNSKLGFGFDFSINSVYPATKEQRDTLMKAMSDAGYTFDFEKKELKKFDAEEYNGEDYGIDSLFHAQKILEKTLGKVDGYQTDDGILAHKCAISAVKKLYEQNPAWSEEDEDMLYKATVVINRLCAEGKEYVWSICTLKKLFYWLKSIKDRVQPQSQWKPSATDVKVLEGVIDLRINPINYHATLHGILEQLKKL